MMPPQHGPVATLSAHQSRVVGALIGVHAGDSLGATLEFEPHSQIAESHPHGLRDIVGGGPFGWPPGHATDDTDLTRAVALAYRDHKPGDDIARLAAENFIDWYTGKWPGRRRGHGPADIGFATDQALSKYQVTRDPANSGAGKDSAGNGSLMRCIPTALFRHDHATIIDESMRISKVTHDDSRCTVSCAAYNVMVYELIRGRPPLSAVLAGESVAADLEKTDMGPVCKAIRAGRKHVSIAELARLGTPSQMKGASGYVLDTLTIAVAAVLDERSLEDVVVDVVRIGNDTDTNAAVAGGILGARDGLAAVPVRWREVLQFRGEFIRIAAALVPV